MAKPFEGAAPLIHCDHTLARRLERAEGRGNAEFVEARAAAFPETGGQWIEVAGAFAMFDGVDSPCTQTFGLGLFDPVTDAAITQLEAFFQERGADVFHEVCPLAGRPLLELLTGRGYHPIEQSNVLFRPISPGLRLTSSRDDSVRVRKVQPGEHDLWARTAAAGWADVAPELEQYLADLGRLIPHQRNAHHFLATKDGEPIAAGAMSLLEGVALLAGACTVPRWRKQGAQLALLEHRLRFAAENGCDLAMIVAEPGSASQRNAERQGFRVAYTRTKWRLGPARADSDPAGGR